MSAMNDGAWVGEKLARKEDHRLTTGKGRFLADLSIPGMLHLTFLRSERAHATIKSIDTSAAKALPGVIAIYTGDDIKDKILPMPQPVVQPNLPAHFPRHWPLAVGKVKFHGEPVAAIVSRDKYVGADAAEEIQVDYGDLPYIGDPEKALEAGSTRVHDDWDDNLIFEMSFTGGDTPEEQAENDAQVDEIMKTADIVIKNRFRVQRCGVTPMETRGVLADWDEADGLVAHITTQRPHIDRLGLSDILGIPAEKVRIISPRDQGGGFGVKAPFYREPILICWLVKELGRPIRWVETRQEHLMAVSQERDQINDLEVAASDDGKLLAIRNRGIADCGDGCEGVYWGFVMPFLGAVELPNGYTWEKGDVKLKVAVTNKSCLSPARAFGEFPTRFAMERSVDMIAHRCGIEPAEVRRINLIPELPYTSVCGEYMDSGDFLKVWDNLMAQADLASFRKKQEEAHKQGRYIGIGFGLGVELSGVSSELMVPMENQPGYGAATIRLDARGKAFVFEGDAPQGQGHETTAAQAVAHTFGIHPNDIVVTTGDTSTTPFGSGTIGARMGSYFVSAAVEAAEVLKKKLVRFFAHDMELEGASEDDFEFKDGEIIYTKDPNIRQTFRDACNRNIMAPINLPEGESAGLEHTAFFEAAKPMIAFNADFCTVEVNPENGQFKILNWTTSEDVGQIINPQIVEGQMQGAIVQGISNTIFEEFIYDENGQQLTADFENYKIATAADVPDMKITHAPTLCPHTPLGSRGIGEGRPSDVPGCITNAVCDALTPFGIEITQLPLRPNMIWRLIQEAKSKRADD